MITQLLLLFYLETDHPSFYSLEKEPARRATPWRMLEHPWFQEYKNKRSNVRKFLAAVWQWNDEGDQQ